MWLCYTSFWASLMGFPVGKESDYNAGDPGSVPGLGRSSGEGIGYLLQYSWAALVAQLVKDLPAMWADLGLIPGLGRSSGKGKGYPLQYSWASLVAKQVKNPLQCRRPRFDSWVGKIRWRRERLLTPVFWPGEFHGLYSP